MEKTVCLGWLNAAQGWATLEGWEGSVPLWSICPAQLGGSVRIVFFSIRILLGPLSAVAAWDNGTHITAAPLLCLCQPTYSVVDGSRAGGANGLGGG